MCLVRPVLLLIWNRKTSVTYIKVLKCRESQTIFDSRMTFDAELIMLDAELRFDQVLPSAPPPAPTLRGLVGARRGHCRKLPVSSEHAPLTIEGRGFFANDC